jgi:hypothetical protein
MVPTTSRLKPVCSLLSSYLVSCERNTIVAMAHFEFERCNMPNVQLVRKGLIGITIFESTTVQSRKYKTLGKERLVRVLRDSGIEDVVNQVLTGVSLGSATICEKHFLEYDESDQTYTVAADVEEANCTSLVSLVHSYVTGRVRTRRLTVLSKRHLELF